MSLEEELDFMEQTAQLQKTFLEAKKNKSEDYEAYRKAKAEWSAHRSHWRGIRDWLQAIETQEEIS